LRTGGRGGGGKGQGKAFVLRERETRKGGKEKRRLGVLKRGKEKPSVAWQKKVGTGRKKRAERNVNKKEEKGKRAKKSRLG